MLFFVIFIKNKLFFQFGGGNMTLRKGIPLAAMERLLRNAGALRVSEDAKIALKQALEAYAQRIGEGATKYAQHASRKTVRAEDIQLATKI